MTFIAEFDPAAIDAAVARAERFGSVEQYLKALQGRARAELLQVAILDKDGTATRYAKQFNPHRGAEAFRAYNYADDLLKARAA